MGELFRHLFPAAGEGSRSEPELWINAISGCLIAASFFCIPVILVYVIRRRSVGKSRVPTLAFAALILAAALTRLLQVWSLWHPAYRARGLANAVMAVIAVATAIYAIRLVPVLLKLASPEQLESMNRQLREEIAGRDEAEEKLRRRSAAELLASEDKLRSCFEAASQAILVVSSNGCISLVNRRTEEMFGYARDELLGQDLEMLLPGRFRAGHLAHRDGYFAGPRVRAMGAGMELAARRKDGTEFPIEIGLSHVNTPEGPLAFTMVSDISERRKAADELRRSNAELIASQDRLRSYFEAASQAILGVTGDGLISLVNRRTEEMFGYSRDELLGQELELLLPERFRRAHVAHRDAYFAEPRVRAMGAGMELSGRRKDGTEFPIEIGLGHATTPEGRLAFGMVSDISERRKAADDLKRVNEELRQSYIEIEQFAHVASHDLQEPLRMVTSYLQLIERRYNHLLDDEGREFIHFAVDGARRMKALIKDLLDFSYTGADTANREVVEGGLLLQNALSNLKTAIEESKAKVTSDPLPVVAVDPVLFTQVFQNLIANAIKFHKDTAPCIHISVERRARDWVFSVRDNGIGIEPHHRDRIFRIFERLHTSEQYSGSGIGLAITRKIVERHGGRIWVESQSGSGSTFQFSISAEMAIAYAANSGAKG